MQKYEDCITTRTNDDLNTVSGASVRVRSYPLLADVVLYSSNDLGAPIGVAGTRINTDANGKFSFYAPNGHYRIDWSGSGIASGFREDILLFDPLEPLDFFNASDWSVVTGTVDALVSTVPLLSYTNGQKIRVRVSGANTVGNPTINVNGLGVRPITKAGGQALYVGDFSAGQEVELTYSTTLVGYEWTNQNTVNLATRLASGLSTLGGTLIGFLQAGIGAVRRTITAKLFDWVHIKDYGAACDGVTLDTAAILAAVAANPNRTIYYNGTPLIDATIFLDGRQKLVGEGGADAGDSSPPSSYFKKKAGMAAVGIVVGFGSMLEGGGISCAGATLGGIQIRGNTARARNYTIFGSTLDLLSGIGCRVGDAIGTNTNSWLLDNVNVSAMGGDGFWFHDGTVGGANVNAGMAVGCQALVNGGRGFVIEHASLNTFLNCLSESNVGIGVHAVGGLTSVPGIGNCWKFGDSEGNAAGDPLQQIVIDQGVNGFQIDSSPFTQVTDNGYFSKRLDRYNDKQVDFVPAFWGSTGATKTGTALTMVGTTATITSVAHGYANGDTIAIGITAGTIANLDGAFVIRNVTANTFDVTCRTDRAKDLPVSAGVIATSLQRCGVYSSCHGRYTFRGTDIEFDLDMTTSALTNLTGVIGIILPWDTANQSGGVGPTVVQCAAWPTYYTGITHTGLLTLPIALNGGRIKFLQNNIGSGLAPAQLGAAGLAAATRLLMSGRYHAFDR